MDEERLLAVVVLQAEETKDKVLVPVVEELAFRGFLVRRLIRANFETVSYRSFTWLSFVGSSLAFGFLHQRMLAGTVAGMCYAGIVLWRLRGENELLLRIVEERDP